MSLPCVALLMLIAAQDALSLPPNIIFLFIDDLGWNDVSFHGSVQIPTPNIDTLAYSGIILNNYYVQPLCTPSRGSLMTGKYPIRLGLQHYVISSSDPWGLSTEEVLLPQHLKKLGYTTHAVGKWHLGFFQKNHTPTNRGFDTFLGYYTGKEDYFTHFEEDDGCAGLDFHVNGELSWNYTGYYGTEVFTDRANAIIKNHDSSKPLFLYVSHQAVHGGNSYSPLQAPIEYIDRFRHIKDVKRRHFAAMTSALDKSVGEIFKSLHQKGMLENSILVFSTDNGGAVEGIDESTGSNFPLRGSKYNMWEGGVRGTALIWSPLISKLKGTASKMLMHVSDWLPTLYAAAGGNPKDLGKIDGYNFWPSFMEASKSPRDQILLNIDPKWKVESIRKGQYKLLLGSVFDGKFDGWFDKEGKREAGQPFEEVELDTQYEVYNTLLESSEVFQILTRKDENYLLGFKPTDSPLRGSCDAITNHPINQPTVRSYRQSPYPHPFAAPVEVKCGTKPENASTNCKPMDDYCLFDVENDPCEYNNLANRLPSVVDELKKLLDNYRSQAVPMRNKEADPEANPKNHGYAWVPWIKKDLNE